MGLVGCRLEPEECKWEQGLNKQTGLERDKMVLVRDKLEPVCKWELGLRSSAGVVRSWTLAS